MKGDLDKNNVSYILMDDVALEDFSKSSRFSSVPGFSVLSYGVANLVGIVKENGQPVYEAGRFHLYRMKW
jgi:hypothetical protein